MNTMDIRLNESIAAFNIGFNGLHLESVDKHFCFIVACVAELIRSGFRCAESVRTAVLDGVQDTFSTCVCRLPLVGVFGDRWNEPVLISLAECLRQLNQLLDEPVEADSAALEFQMALETLVAETEALVAERLDYVRQQVEPPPQNTQSQDQDEPDMARHGRTLPLLLRSEGMSGRWLAWRHKTDEEVVREALESRQLLLAQGFLEVRQLLQADASPYQQEREDGEAAEDVGGEGERRQLEWMRRHGQAWHKILAVGLHWMLQCLDAGDVDKAKFIIKSMGLRTADAYRMALRRTSDPQHRQLVASRLRSAGKLLEDEELALLVLRLVDLVGSELERYKAEGADDAEVVAFVQQRSGNLILADVLDLSTDFIQRLAMYLLMLTNDSDLSVWVRRRPADLWRFLLTSERTSMLMAWLNNHHHRQHQSDSTTTGDAGSTTDSTIQQHDSTLSQHDSTLSQLDSALQQLDSTLEQQDSSLQQLDFILEQHDSTLLHHDSYESTSSPDGPSWLRDLPLPADPADLTQQSDAPAAVTSPVLDQLAKHGILSTRCLHDVQLLCARLIAVGLPDNLELVFRDPLPLLSCLITAGTADPRLAPLLYATVARYGPALRTAAAARLRRQLLDDPAGRRVCALVKAERRGWTDLQDLLEVEVRFRACQEGLEVEEWMDGHALAVLMIAVSCSWSIRNHLHSGGDMRKDLVSPGDMRKELLSLGDVSTDVLTPGKVTTLVVSPRAFRKALPVCPELQHVLEPAASRPPAPNVYDILHGRVPLDVGAVFHFQQRNPWRKTVCTSLPSLSTCVVEDAAAAALETIDDCLTVGRPLLAVKMSLVQSTMNSRTNGIVPTLERLSQLGCVDATSAASVIVYSHLMARDVAAVRANVAVATYSGAASRERGSTGLWFRDRSAAAAMLARYERRLMAELATSAVSDRWQQCGSGLMRWQHAVQFARQQELQFPECYPRRLAQRDEWLRFLVYLQLYQYPRSQSLRLAGEFSCPTLREHMETTVRNLLVARPSSKHTRLSSPEHDCNVTLLSSSPGTSLTSPGTSLTSSTPISLVSGLDLPADENPTVISALSACWSDPSPGQALLQTAITLGHPALTALAANCVDVSTMDCFCGWLEVMISDCVGHEVSDGSSAGRVRQLILDAVRTRHLLALQHAVNVFFPECALPALVALLLRSLAMEDTDRLRDALTELQQQINSLKDEKDCERVVYDRRWVCGTATAAVLVAVSQLLTDSVALRLLQLLVETRVADTLLYGDVAADFALMRRLSVELGGCGVRMRWPIDLPSDGCRHNCGVSSDWDGELGGRLRSECRRVVLELCSRRLLDTAERLALKSGVSTDPITLTVMEDSLESVADQDRGQFWLQCDAYFHDKQLSPPEASRFFRQHSQLAKCPAERYQCLRLSWMWLGEKCTDLSIAGYEVLTLEKDLWVAYVRAQVVSEIRVELPFSSVAAGSGATVGWQRPPSSTRLTVSGAVCSATPPTSSPPVDPAVTRGVVGHLLDSGHVRQAALVSRCFAVNTQDLCTTIELVRLAEEPLFEADTMDQLSDAPYTSALYSGSSACDGRLTQMSLLSSRLQCGRDVAAQILSCRRAAAALQLTYSDVVGCRDPLLLLGSVLGQPALQDRRRTALDVIRGLRLPDAAVTEVILSHAIKIIKSGTHCIDLLLAICPDSSRLACRLLDTADDTSAISESSSFSVDVLVAAHAAHTACLNLQGISDVLSRARLLAHRLLNGGHFKLMVRLVCGIGRYTEMSYVFDMLLQEHQLEQLLAVSCPAAGDWRLPEALLQHLAVHHPDDAASRQLVEQRFSRHVDTARRWMERGSSLMQLLSAESTGSGVEGRQRRQQTQLHVEGSDVQRIAVTSATLKRLSDATTAFLHAAAFYNQAEMLCSAAECVALAQLAALQTRLCATFVAPAIAGSTGSGSVTDSTAGPVMILNRSSHQLNQLFAYHLSYGEACVVLRAHPSCADDIDWSLVLCARLLQTDWDSYLRDYLQLQLAIPDALAGSIVTRVLSLGVDVAIERLGVLAASFSSLETRYRVASQLNLRDQLDQLLGMPDSGWLKDTVWATGGCRPLLQ